MQSLFTTYLFISLYVCLVLLGGRGEGGGYQGKYLEEYEYMIKRLIQTGGWYIDMTALQNLNILYVHIYMYKQWKSKIT